MATVFTEIDLKNYVPKLVLERAGDPSGTEISAEYWNTRWREATLQGNYNSKTLYELLQLLQSSILSSTNGTEGIAYPALTLGSTTTDGTLAGALQFMWQLIQALSSAVVEMAGSVEGGDQIIANLGNAISNVYTRAEADHLFQTKIAYGEEQVPSGTYPDGTIYLQLAPEDS